MSRSEWCIGYFVGRSQGPYLMHLSRHVSTLFVALRSDRHCYRVHEAARRSGGFVTSAVARAKERFGVPPSTDAGLGPRGSARQAEARLRPGRSPERVSAEAKGGAAWTVGCHPDGAAPADAFRVRPRQGRPRPDFVDGQNPACCSVSAGKRPGVKAAPLQRVRDDRPVVSVLSDSEGRRAAAPRRPDVRRGATLAAVGGNLLGMRYF